MAPRRRVVLLLAAAAAAAAAAVVASRALRRRRRAAGASATAAAAVRPVTADAEEYDGLDSAVSFSARSIAAARAVETARGAGDALFQDPFAVVFAGARALASASGRTSDGRIAVRTRYFDDALAVRSPPARGAW
jgi:hypothetical protein